MKIIKLKEIDSTHKFALKMLESENVFECGIIAENQTNGIGRCERQWVAANGNLYSSVIKKLPLHKDVCKISLAVACAVHETIGNYLESNANDLFLHWPNDIYYKNKKISGILIAVVGEWAVISVGINVHSVPVSTSISLENIVDVKNVSVFRLFDDVLSKLDFWLRLLQKNGFDRIKKYWLKNIVGMNQNVVIKNGNDNISGIIKGIDELGRLILEHGEKIVYISSGDMFINEKNIMVNYG